MLAAAGLDGADPADALADGRAMDVWRRMIAAQGGDPDARPADGAARRTSSRRRRTACWCG
jgi:thymidine phosphorylase